ncbi:hypothetical protein L7F22_012046 [Adiantum nelumboides]|nr:hypothetical protein [Adiantum nelumboides]
MTVFVCCPSLQPTILSEGEHVRLIQESGSMKLKVDDMYDAKYASFRDGFLQEEAAFVSMLNLLKQEKTKGKKKKRQGQKIKETVSLEDMQVQPDESPQETQEGTYSLIEGASSTAAAGISPMELVDKTIEGYAKEVGKVSAQSTDEDFFLDGKIIVQGKTKSSLEILIDIWVQHKNFSTLLSSVQDNLKGVQDDLKGLKGLIQPIVTRWFPYDEVQMGKQDLERLALLYMREGEKVHKSDLVEVDMLLKVVVGGLESQASPHCLESSQVSARAFQREFTHLVIGEYSRSTMLCARAINYQHPLQPSRDSSAKLLYKLIQVERATTAATQYYATGDHIVDAAAIMSPSFKRLSDPELLIRTVLPHVNGELPIVQRLLSQGKMWLLDL